MKLPISNRKIIVNRLFALELLVIVLGFIFFGDIILNQEYIEAYWLPLLLINLSLIGLIIYLNNIKSAILKDEQIQVEFNNRTITIPVKNIVSVTTASERGDIFRGTHNKSYYLKINKRYIFGKNLILSYTGLKSFKEDPIEIQLIKSIQKSYKKE
jgi:hypothetical protein